MLRASLDLAHTSIVDQASVIAKRPTHKSRLTNGSLFAAADGRTAASRRFRDLIANHVSDLGGVENCSEAQLSIVRRASALEVALEQMEESIADDRDVFDVASYTTAANSLRRLLETIGLKRVPKDVDNLHDYIAGRAATA